MEDTTHAAISQIASQRHGVFTREEARALGISDTAITERVKAGRYLQVEAGVFAIAGSPNSLRQSLAAAVASFPSLAAASHQTAAEMWGLTNRGIRTLEIVTTRWDRVRRDNVRVHESLDLIDADVTERDGIQVTVPARTLVDLGASNRWLVESALEQGIRLRLVTLNEVEAVVKRVAKRGRRGVGVIRPLIATRRRWDTATDSALEDRFRTLLSDAGFPDPQQQFTVRDERSQLVARADFAYPAARLLIELDSEAHHMDRLTFRRDRRKQNRATVLGWTVLRYTWWDVVEQPWRIRDELKTLLGLPG